MNVLIWSELRAVKHGAIGGCGEIYGFVLDFTRGDLCISRSYLCIKNQQKKKRSPFFLVVEGEIFLLLGNKFELLYQDKISWVVTMCVQQHTSITARIVMAMVQ